MDYEKVLGEHKFPTYEELKTGLIRLIDEGKISREDASRLLPELRESEDERTRKELLDYVKYNKEHTPETIPGEHWDRWISYLEKQKEQKPSEWHPEDEQNLNVCLSYIKDEPLRSWLIGAIHVRYDKPAEWSEEDKAHIESLLKRLDGMCKKGATFTQTRFAVSEDMDWLKDLRPSWKPSEEQMRELKNAVNELCRNGLASLYNDLQKL